MHMRLKLIFLSLLLATSLSVEAQWPDSLQTFERELSTKNDGITSIVAHFTQTRQVAVLAQAASKDGTFFFRYPGDMLLAFNDGDYIKMTTEWFEMKNGVNITTTKVSSNPALRSLSSILSACVVGNFEQIIKGFSINTTQTDNEWIATLTPQRGKAAAKISHIVIHFDKVDMSLNTLKMEEKSGDYTTYRFSNKQFNVTVDSNLFNISK